MIILSFRSKRDKEQMLEKAKRMADYANEFVDCLEESQHEEYGERASYRYQDEYEHPQYRGGRYGYGK